VNVFLSIRSDLYKSSASFKFREVYKRAFENAGIKYFNPHSFRNTLTRLGHKMCKNPEQYKAWSQNFGHENPATTFCVYGKIPDYQQVDIIRNMTNDKNKI
jgi:integrase